MLSMPNGLSGCLRSRSTLLLVALGILALMLAAAPARADDPILPPCDQRPNRVTTIEVDASRYCLEQVAESNARMAFTALAADPDGTLYVTRPHTGEVFAITDTAGDRLPDQVERIAGGLTLPNALVYREDALYIAGGSHIYRWREGTLTTLVDDLPDDGGLWNGGLTVFDGHLYVGLSLENDDTPAMLRYDLDGETREPIAHGLRQPAGLTVWQDTVWITDSNRSDSALGRLDEINRLETGAHYGWPHCVGPGSEPASEQTAGTFNCADAQAPVYSLRTGSSPVALAAYQGTAFPFLEGSLLVALMGSYNASIIDGYALIAIPSTDGPLRIIAPSPLMGDSTGLNFNTLRPLQATGGGFYPHPLYGLAISPEGWIYLSAGSTAGGAIYVLRPVD